MKKNTLRLLGAVLMTGLCAPHTAQAFDWSYLTQAKEYAQNIASNYLPARGSLIPVGLTVIAGITAIIAYKMKDAIQNRPIEEQQLYFEILKLVGGNGGFKIFENPYAPAFGVKYTVEERLDEIVHCPSTCLEELKKLKAEIIEHLNVEKLENDPQYQRALQEKMYKQLSKTWPQFRTNNA